MKRERKIQQIFLPPWFRDCEISINHLQRFTFLMQIRKVHIITKRFSTLIAKINYQYMTISFASHNILLVFKGNCERSLKKRILLTKIKSVPILFMRQWKVPLCALFDDKPISWSEHTSVNDSENTRPTSSQSEFQPSLWHWPCNNNPNTLHNTLYNNCTST